MKSSGLYGVAAAFAGMALVAQGVTEEPARLDSIAVDVDAPGFSEVVEVAPLDNGMDVLRQQYLDAARQHASLMDEESLRQAIETERKKLAELPAQQALQQVERQLQQIIHEYSETSAGLRAKDLLKALQSSVDDDLEPVPDSRSIEHERQPENRAPFRRRSDSDRDPFGSELDTVPSLEKSSDLDAFDIEQ